MVRRHMIARWMVTAMAVSILCVWPHANGQPATVAEHQTAGQCESQPAPSLTWGPIERIGGPSFRTAAAVGPDGMTTVAWTPGNTTRTRRACPGQPWQQRQTVGRPAHDVRLGVDRDGTVTMLGLTERARTWHVWVSRNRDGRGWTPPRELGSGRQGDLGGVYMDLAVSWRGAVVVAWAGASDPRRLHAAYLPRDGGWSKPVKFNASWRSIPSAAIDVRGRASVAYQGPGGLLRLAQWSGAHWRGPVVLPARTSTFETSAYKAGEVVFMYQERRALRTARLVNGEWVRPLRLRRPGRVASLEVEAARDGSATFTWTPGRFGRRFPRELVSRTQTGGGALDPATEVAPHGISCTAATVATNRRLDTMVAWIDQHARAAFRAKGQDWSESVDLSAPRTVAPCAGQSADLGPSGAAVVAWQEVSDDGDPRGVLVRRATTS